MPNTTQKIWEILNQEEIVKKTLYQKLINHRALARYLQQKYFLDASIDSIISAIRRFEISEGFKDQFEKVPKLLSGSDISTKNNLVVLTLRRDVIIYENLLKFLKEIEKTKRHKFRYVLGETSLKVIADSDALPLIERSFDKKKVLFEKKDLGEIKIHLEPKLHGTRGVAAKIISEISQQDINIVEVLTCLPDFLIYVSEKDLPKAHETMIKLCA